MDMPNSSQHLHTCKYIQIALTKLPSAEELEIIINKLEEEETLTCEETNKRIKHKLKTIYNIGDNEISILDDPEFITIYNNPNQKLVSWIL